MQLRIETFILFLNQTHNPKSFFAIAINIRTETSTGGWLTFKTRNTGPTGATIYIPGHTKNTLSINATETYFELTCYLREMCTQEKILQGFFMLELNLNVY